MTMQTFVLFDKKDLPSFNEVQQAILAHGFDFTFKRSFALDSEDAQLIDAEFEGLKSQLDYLFEVYNQDDWDLHEDELAKLDGVNSVASFNTFSNAQEIVGMMVVSALICKLTKGVIVSEFFSEHLIDHEDAIEFAESVIESARAQFDGPSQMREILFEDDHEMISVEIEEIITPPSDDEIVDMAHNILDSVKSNYKRDLHFINADLNEFPGLDTDFYQNSKATLAELGFEHLFDCENSTMSIEQNIHTVISVFQHAVSDTICSLYYIPDHDLRICDFINAYDNDRFIHTSNAPASIQQGEVPDILTQFLEWEKDLQQLFIQHTLFLTEKQHDMGYANPINLSSLAEFEHMSNTIERIKADHLESIGWVTQEYLMANSDGDHQLSSRVYEEIQRINSAA